MPTLLIPLAHLLAASALAQDGQDAHGFVQAANDGEILDPIAVYRAERNDAGRFGLNALFELAESPLVLYKADDSEEVLLDNLLTLNLGGHFAVHDKIAIAISAPVHLAYVGAEGSGPALVGDIRLALPVAILAPSAGEVGFSLAAVPYLDVPTGNPSRFLGNEGVAGGAIAAASYGSTQWEVGGNLGFQAAPAIEFANLRGGSRLIAAASAGYAFTDTLGVRGEVVLRPNLSRNETPWTDAPGEALLTARGAYPSGLNWTAGGAVGLTPGASTADYRLFAGVGVSFGGSPRDADRDGIVDDADACPLEAEVVNEHEDADGCPDQISTLAVVVVDDAGRPVPGAAVTVDGAAHVADAQGRVLLKGLTPGSEPAIAASAPGHVDQTATLALVDGANEQRVTLQALPARVTVTVKDTSGNLLDARIGTEVRAGSSDMVPTGADGVETIALAPGEVTIIAQADGYTTERRALTVGADEEVAVEVALAPAKAVIDEKEVVILEAVQFAFDSDRIEAASFPLLDAVAAVLLDHPEITRVEVQGHTDDLGQDAYNLKLSQARAEAVVRYLVSKGVAAGRLQPKGYGETQPAVPNTSEANQARNRRVQFVILEQARGSGGK